MDQQRQASRWFLTKIQTKARPVQYPWLTKQEKRIIAMVIQGLSNKEIAWELHRSPRTIKWHLTVIYAKARVSGRVTLAVKFHGRLL
jgi:DNA-binding CsgD family transcriptional regulator